jgi:hypothetical protein
VDRCTGVRGPIHGSPRRTRPNRAASAERATRRSTRSRPEIRRRARPTKASLCAVCHGDRIASSGRHPSTDAHDTSVDPRFATSELCAGCHEFPFQTHASGEQEPPPMQGTVSEWRAAGGVGSCQSCHMPVVTRGGRRWKSHRFDGTSKEILARSLAVDVSAVRRRADVEVTLRLRARNVGHAVPTGDRFRTLVVEATADTRAFATLGRSSRLVEGFDDDGRAGRIRRDGVDRRPRPDAPQTVRLAVRAAPGAPIAWSIRHRRAPPRRQGSRDRTGSAPVTPSTRATPSPRRRSRRWRADRRPS